MLRHERPRCGDVVRFEARAFSSEPEEILGEVTSTMTQQLLVVPMHPALRWSKWMRFEDVTLVKECPECGHPTRAYPFDLNVPERMRERGPFCNHHFHRRLGGTPKPTLEVDDEVPVTSGREG